MSSTTPETSSPFDAQIELGIARALSFCDPDRAINAGIDLLLADEVATRSLLDDIVDVEPYASDEDWLNGLGLPDEDLRGFDGAGGPSEDPFDCVLARYKPSRFSSEAAKLTEALERIITQCPDWMDRGAIDAARTELEHRKLHETCVRIWRQCLAESPESYLVSWLASPPDTLGEVGTDELLVLIFAELTLRSGGACKLSA